MVYQWHKRFRSGRESIEDDEHSGRTSILKTDENIDKVKKMLVNNRKLTIRELVEDLNIAYGFAQDIVVNDLGFRRVAAKLVPKDLNFMHIFTEDETWIYEYDMRYRYPTSEWRAPNEPSPKKPHRFQSKIKAMLTVFIDYHGVVLHEIFPEYRTVDKEYYLGVMKRLREAICQKRKDTLAKQLVDFVP